MLPPTDEQGRFVRELVDGSIAARVFARCIDLAVMLVITLGVNLVAGPPWGAVVGGGWFLASDALGAPGKWLLQLEAVGLDGRRVSLFGSLSRNVTLGAPYIGHVVSGSFETQDTRWIAGCLGVLLFVVELGTLIIAPQNRRWSDQFSGTRVVRR